MALFMYGTAKMFLLCLMHKQNLKVMITLCIANVGNATMQHDDSHVDNKTIKKLFFFSTFHCMKLVIILLYYY